MGSSPTELNFLEHFSGDLLLARCLSIIATGLILLTSGCESDTRQDVAGDALEIMEDYAKVLRSVKDEESAKAAVAKLDALAVQLEEVSARLEKLPPDEAITDEAFIRRFNGRMKSVTASLTSTSRRIAANPAIRKHIAEPIRRMNEAGNFAKFAPPTPAKLGESTREK